MSFYDVAGHWLIYLMVSIGILFVAGLAVVSMRKSWKRAIAKGFPREKLMTVVKSAVSATIIPSLAIVIGFFSLVTILGVPWPWWRLSVVGSVTYETMAADSAVKAAGLDMTKLSMATAEDFVLVMFVMSIGIIGGLFFSPFASKSIQAGTMKLKVGDKRWGALGSSVFFMVILAVFVVPLFLDYSKTGIAKLLTLVTSGVITVILNVLADKCKLGWLRGFTLALSLLLAMASSVLWVGLLN
ncbi:DUF5058 family protein [Treponema primitia]|uniref:DUF5058 family protein n=1 Tax=Treponema primitia TaxID=88058 RepID=UPI00025552B6|nr:DUF5058 family protein [Treponema primitia]